MKTFFLFALILLGLSTNAQSITGTWSGKINVPGSPLTFVIHIHEENGTLKSKGDSPDQKLYNIPLDKTTFENNELIISNSGTTLYKGELKNSDEITGTFTQNGYSFRLNLKRGIIEKVISKRPQEPKAPFPYMEEEVSFTNKKDDVTLSGTLTFPEHKGKFPAVILITGSGPQDRNEEILGHKPFLVIADYLTRNGYAVLRYDDRGYGKSTGNFAEATSYDFAEDTKAALEFLKHHKNIDSKRIGLAGHSEGGTIAQIVAAENSDVYFIILLASPGLPGDKTMVLQNDAMAKAMGIPDFARLLNKKINQSTYDILKKDTSKEVALEELKQLHKTNGIPIENKEHDFAIATSDWYRSFMRFDPMPYLEKINAKVLALNGENDTQIVAKENLEGIKKGLEHNPNVTIISYPHLNHLFQTSETGLVDEYSEIEETFNEKVLKDITDWLHKNVK